MPEDSAGDLPSKVPKPLDEQPEEAEKLTASWLIPVVTALVLISIFCAYYFVYVASRREYLENRNFR